MLRLRTWRKFHPISADGPYGPTCDGFDDLIDNVENMVCTRNEACDTANCNIMQAQFSSYRLSLTLLSCRDPRPGVRVVVRDGDNPGQLVLDRVVDESVSGIDLGSGATLDVTLDQMEDSLGLAVRWLKEMYKYQIVYSIFVVVGARLVV